MCDFCATACLRDIHAEHMLECSAVNLDCADVCRMAASVMARDSAQIPAVCELCARICEACAQECESHEAAHCQDCAESCRHCAELCRALIS